ncbi:VTT domain-containing protein [Candidatus Woesearchaeota archaeon]|nr:VTT domain-containing protein [Candidatus Woesearchaeota archaeon]
MEKEPAIPEHKLKSKAVRKEGGLSFTDKLFIMLVAASAIYLAYIYFQSQILELLKANPYVWAFFSHIFNEISKRTILGFFYACFFGSLFFIVLPMELLFLYYLSLGFSVPLIMALMLIGSLMGLCLDYMFGLIVGARLVKFILREKFDKFHNMITRWGSFVIFIGNAIVFPIQPVSVVIGSARFSFAKFIIFTILGLFVKIFVLVVLSMYFQDTLYPLLKGFA